MRSLAGALSRPGIVSGSALFICTTRAAVSSRVSPAALQDALTRCTPRPPTVKLTLAITSAETDCSRSLASLAARNLMIRITRLSERAAGEPERSPMWSRAVQKWAACGPLATSPSASMALATSSQ